MSRVLGVSALTALLTACATPRAHRVPFAGAVAGISTLSADARTVVTNASAAVGLYKPENGPALNLIAGLHVTDYFSVQGNFVWNRNSLALSSVGGADPAFFEERRGSRQRAFVADGLLYFRNRESWARPYLSAGIGLVRFESQEGALLASRGAPPRPPASFGSTEPALRVAVGIDVGSAKGWSFRYSFSETITRNPVSARLTPPGQRSLANFQNLFGAIRSF